MYRPHKSVSIGIANFKGQNKIDICNDPNDCSNTSYDYNNVRMGIAFRPFEFFKERKDSNKFMGYSNFTIGYDKTMNNLGFSLDAGQSVLNPLEEHFLDKDSYQEQYFITFTAIPGIDISYFMHDDLLSGKTYGLNLSLQVGKHVAGSSYYPSNPFYSISSGSNSFYYYNYSQKKEGVSIPSDTEKYIKINLECYFIEEEPTKSFFSIPFFSSKEGTQLKSWVDKIDNIAKEISPCQG